MSTLFTLVGGIGLFLLGMAMMTDGLKLAAGDALRTILNSWTRNHIRALLSGFFITALVQSSSAVTVATVGFVNAGLLTLQQALWVVFGSNLGTTITGWLVAAVGVKVDIGALALPLLGAGMLLRLAARTNERRAGLGQAMAGFGVFFLGVSILQGGFSTLATDLNLPSLNGGPLMILAFVGLGALITVMTQSSSAAVAIILTATAGGLAPLEPAAAAVIGANLGTTSTAILATLSATAAAKRVAAGHVAFNLLTALAALLLLPLLLDASARLSAFGGGAPALTLAVFNTLINTIGVMLVWPLAGRLVQLLSKLFRSQEEEVGRPQFLDNTLVELPSMALSALVHELSRMAILAGDLSARRIGGDRPPASDPDGLERGLLQLAENVRLFINRLSAAPLPPEAVQALPDLIRALQHLEDQTLLGQAPPARKPATGAVADGLNALRTAALAALPSADGADDQSLLEVEARYQTVKSTLLAAAASGAIPVADMDQQLDQAHQWRQSVRIAHKARRRLAPWTGFLDSGSAVATDAP